MPYWNMRVMLLELYEATMSEYCLQASLYLYIFCSLLWLAIIKLYCIILLRSCLEKGRSLLNLPKVLEGHISYISWRQYYGCWSWSSWIGSILLHRAVGFPIILWCSCVSNKILISYDFNHLFCVYHRWWRMVIMKPCMHCGKFSLCNNKNCSWWCIFIYIVR